MGVAVGVAVLVILGAILVPGLLSDDDAKPGADPSGSVDTNSLAQVQVYDVPPYVHVSDGVAVDYPQTPPVGGDHWNAWLECGVYGGEVPDEYAVHDLEHGSVWITYRPDEVDEAGVEALAEVLPQNGIMSPYPTQEAPVVLTVWGAQLAVLGADDPRIALFLDKYDGGGTSPEAFSSCAGGLTEAPR